MARPAKRTPIQRVQYFDLNIEKVLEHWPVEFAVREVIANALDEHAITGTAEPTITTTGNETWVVGDLGRGLHYEHLTQKEDPEKRRHPSVIGQFGMGLKDALAVFHRRGVDVELRSPHGDITTAMRPKGEFADVRTLHAAVRPPSHQSTAGTQVVLRGVSAETVETAKSFFLRYSHDQLLETTRYGQVLARPDGTGPARIYVKGLLVAEEPNFLFSYNITSVHKPLRQALNRERTNVGRTAYTDRVKAILKQCSTSAVARPLADDLAQYTTGKIHDELSWHDVAVHACRVLATHDKVVFITAVDLATGSPQLQYARDDGYRLVVVPDDIARKLHGLTNFDGDTMFDLHTYRQAWNGSFAFQFVPADELTKSEKIVFALTHDAIKLAKINPHYIGVREVLISETMRLNETGHPVLGVYEPLEQRIVVRRDALGAPQTYCGVLLHELTHAKTGATDGTLAFEEALTELVGTVTHHAITTDERTTPRH